MNIEQLRQVIAIAETGSMNRAAKQLFLSQPNISSSMKALEKEIGQPIFDRSHGAARLTEFGSIFLEHAQSICEKVDFLQAFCETKHALDGVLHVAAYHMPEAYAAYVKLLGRYDGLYFDFTYLTGHVRFTMDQLQSGRAELAVEMLTPVEKAEILNKQEYSDFEYRRLASCPFGIVIGPRHPYYHLETDTLSYEEMKTFSNLMTRNLDDLLGMVDDCMAMFDLSSLNTVEMSTPEDFERRLLNGDDFVLISYQKYRELCLNYPELRLFRIRGCKDEYEIGYLFSRSKGLSPIAEEYLAILREELAANPLLA